MFTDFSDIAVEINGVWKPLLFYLKSMIPDAWVRMTVSAIFSEAESAALNI